MIFISGIIILLLCLFFSCSQQEPSPTLPVAFNKTVYMNQTEAAFFSGSPLKELRILKNEIYARHGRIFESKDLKDHFSKTNWYHPSKKYSDTMLSKAELEAIADIKGCEKYLQNPGDKDGQHFDSVKTFFKSSRRFDTTIVDFLDYTGDGKKEKCVTGISRKGDSIIVHHVIINKNDTIYNKTEVASFASEKDPLPVFDVYNNLKTALRLSPFKASLQSVSPDLKKQYEGKKEFKKYLAKFKGEVLLTITGEGTGCSYFWYAPERKFETLYCE